MATSRAANNYIYEKMGRPKYSSNKKKKGMHKMKGGHMMKDEEMRKMK